MTDALSLGTRIRAARKEHHLTQAELAALATISERTVRDIERDAGNPSFAAVSAVATALGLTVGVTP